MFALLNNRRFRAVVLALVAVLVATLAIVAANPSSSDAGHSDVLDRDALAKAQALAATPSPLGPSARSVAAATVNENYQPEDVREVAASVSAVRIPTPPGLNTGLTLRWEQQGMGGPVPAYLVDELLEANALRDWIWFGAHNDLTPEQREIIALLPKWAASQPVIGRIQPAVDAILSGDRATAQKIAAGLYPDTGHQPPPPPTAP